MRLHLADIHLQRARLFFREKFYPWQSPQTDLAAAATKNSLMRRKPSSVRNSQTHMKSCFAITPFGDDSKDIDNITCASAKNHIHF